MIGCDVSHATLGPARGCVWQTTGALLQHNPLPPLILSDLLDDSKFASGDFKRISTQIYCLIQPLLAIDGHLLFISRYFKRGGDFLHTNI